MVSSLNTQLSAADISALTPTDGTVVYNTTTGEFQFRQAGVWLITSGGILTDLATGTGLTGGPITSSGTIALADTTVTPGSYTAANITVNAQGQITAAANGTGTALPGPGVIVTDSSGNPSAVSSLTDNGQNLILGLYATTGSFSGIGNVSVGDNNFNSLVNVYQNTAVGSTTMQNLTHGSANTGCGYGTLNATTTGYDNAAVGYQASNLENGFENCSLGSLAGGTNSVNSNNCIFIGYQADAQIPGAALTNAIVIGSNAYVNANNTMVLGGTGSYAVSVVVGDVSAASSAILDLVSTNKGFLPPVMTTTQKTSIASPAAGLQVYDKTLNQMSYFNGTTWLNWV